MGVSFLNQSGTCNYFQEKKSFKVFPDGQYFLDRQWGFHFSIGSGTCNYFQIFPDRKYFPDWRWGFHFTLGLSPAVLLLKFPSLGDSRALSPLKFPSLGDCWAFSPFEYPSLGYRRAVFSLDGTIGKRNPHCLSGKYWLSAEKVKKKNLFLKIMTSPRTTWIITFVIRLVIIFRKNK